MATYIKQGDIFGRVGTEIGKGLAEQIPKEVERNRLASGLKQLGEQKGLTPFQQFSGLASTPGITPQMIDSGSQLLRQQQYLDAIKNQYQQGGPQAGNKGYVPNQQDLQQPVKGEVPTLADEQSTAQSYKEYIPPTEQQERAEANENFQKNPARYNYDFDNALKERKAITARNQEIQKSYQTQEATAVAKEEKVKGALKTEVEKLGLKDVPPKAYQRFEEKVLNSILPKSQGGQGLTQEQAIKNYSKELEQSDRNYKDLGSLSAWSPNDFDRDVNALQKSFAKLGDQQQMRDQLISDYGVSPRYASHRAYPIRKGEIPTLNKFGSQVGTTSRGGVSFQEINDGVYSQIQKEMGKNHSPLSVAYELDERGESGSAFLKYLDKHRDHLEGWQIEELSKPTNVYNLTDIWLRAFERER